MLAAMLLRGALTLIAALVLANTQAFAQCVLPPLAEGVVEVEGESAAGRTRRDRIGRMVAPIMVNGAGPFRFIIDTGANRSVVSDSLATRLGLTTIGSDTVHTVHGETVAPLVSVASLSYENLILPGGQVPMLQGAVLAGEQGLLGVDGMQGRRLRLDFEENCIEIVPARNARPLGRNWTRVRGELRFGHLVVVPGRVNGLRVNVLIDTGSNTSLANRALHTALNARVRHNRQAADYARAYTAGEPIVLDTAIIVPDMDIGELEVTNMTLFVGDFHVFALWEMLEEPTVLVGMDVLSAARGMAIDYERGLVWFQLRGSNRAGARLDDPTFTSTTRR